MCMTFAIDGQPSGPLEYLMVSKHWERLLLGTPSLWTQLYLQNGADEMARISTFLYLSRNYSLHVDIVTVLPDMDSLRLIIGDISRVATITIRPGASDTFTYLYMRQWKRSASYILATLYNQLLPSLVLSDVRHSGFVLRNNDQWLYWVIFMEIRIKTKTRRGDTVLRALVKPSDDWKYIYEWEDHITRYASVSQYVCKLRSLLNSGKRTIRGYTDQAARVSSINSVAGFASSGMLQPPPHHRGTTKLDTSTTSRCN
jgi:hypothetical protein